LEQAKVLENLLQMAGYEEESVEFTNLWNKVGQYIRPPYCWEEQEQEHSISRIIFDVFKAEEGLPEEERQKLFAEFEVKRLGVMRDKLDKRIEEYKRWGKVNVTETRT
jgi:hypothetical protein